MANGQKSIVGTGRSSRADHFQCIQSAGDLPDGNGGCDCRTVAAVAGTFNRKRSAGRQCAHGAADHARAAADAVARRY